MITVADSDSPNEPILLTRPVTSRSLAAALGLQPFLVIRSLMELDYFVSLDQELDEDSLKRYSRSADFEYQIVDKE